MSFWLPRLASLGMGFWFLGGIAVLCGWLSARHILRPEKSEDDDPIAQVSLYRSVVGFAFVLVLSWSFRPPGDTVDSSLGDFNIAILVAIGVTLLSLLVLTVLTPGWDLPRVWGESGSILRRIWHTALGVGGLLAVGFLIGRTDELTPRWIILGLFALFLGSVAFYAASCWYIARHWFGVTAAHPVLGPVVTALTVCVITAKELRFDGPGPLPVRTWLLISFCGLVTTLGVCLWEAFAYAAPARGGTFGWPPALAATATGAVLLPGLLLIADGSAQHWLCAGERPRVNCTVQPWVAPVATPAAFELHAAGGVDLNVAPPVVSTDVRYADLILDPQPGGTVLRTDGRHALAVWPLLAEPDRNRCSDLFDSRQIAWSGVRAERGMVLCLETTGGQLASVEIRDAGEGGITGTATVWS
jgi:hypothetical protein